MRLSRSRRWLLRAAGSMAVVLMLVFWVPLDTVWSSIRQVRPGIWVAGLAMFLAGHLLNALKFRLIVGPRFAPLSACLQAQFAGLVANLGLPGLAGGDVVRAAYLAPTAGTGRVAVASLVDRLLDTAVLVVAIAVALPLAGAPGDIGRLIWRGGEWMAGLAVLGAMVAVPALPQLQRSRLLGKLMPMLTDLRSRSASAVTALAISLVVQPLFIVTNIWLAKEVALTVASAAWFVAWPASKLTAILPVSLGGLGVREAALVSLMAPYGAPADKVLATGLLWEGILITGAVVGFVATQIGFRRAGAPSEDRPGREDARHDSPIRTALPAGGRLPDPSPIARTRLSPSPAPGASTARPARTSSAHAVSPGRSWSA